MAIVCDHCFEKLAKKATILASVWSQMCDKHFAEGIFSCHPSHDETLRYFENKGYIVSTENADEVRVNVLGLKNEDNITYYCPGSCDDC